MILEKKLYVKRILDPKDHMDYDPIPLDKFKLNMKFYYPIIIELDHTPEEFFKIAREKNEALAKVERSDSDSEEGNSTQIDSLVESG